MIAEVAKRGEAEDVDMAIDDHADLRSVHGGQRTGHNSMFLIEEQFERSIGERGLFGEITSMLTCYTELSGNSIHRIPSRPLSSDYLISTNVFTTGLHLSTIALDEPRDLFRLLRRVSALSTRFRSAI